MQLFHVDVADDSGLLAGEKGDSVGLPTVSSGSWEPAQNQVPFFAQKMGYVFESKNLICLRAIPPGGRMLHSHLDVR
jgi:hypothetical protein